MVSKKNITPGLLATFCLVGFIYLFVAQAYYAFNFTVDDAYISLRYAKHLAAGHGLTWNITEPPIEGYSNFLLVVIESLLLYFKLPALTLIKLGSLGALFISSVLLYGIAKFYLPGALALLPSFLMLLHRGQILWSVSGLETAYYQSLVMAVIYCIIRGIKGKSNGLFSCAGLLLAIAALFRPEAPLLALLFAGLLVIKDRAAAKSFCVWFAALYIPYFVARWWYFGRMLPNPVYCKALFSVAPGWLDLEYVLLLLPFLVFCIPHFVYKHNYKDFFLSLPSLVYLLAFYNADVVVAYGHRFFLPVFILMLPLFVSGLLTLVEVIAPKRPRPEGVHWAASLALVISIVFIPNYLYLNDFSSFTDNTRRAAKLRREVGLWLKAHLKPGEKASVGDCGLIPWTAESTIIDSYCLNNRKMTSAPISLSYPKFLNWLVNIERPRYIILLSLRINQHGYFPPFDKLALSHHLFAKQYSLTKVFRVGDNKNGYFYEIYIRGGTKSA